MGFWRRRFCWACTAERIWIPAVISTADRRWRCAGLGRGISSGRFWQGLVALGHESSLQPATCHGARSRPRASAAMARTGHEMAFSEPEPPPRLNHLHPPSSARVPRWTRLLRSSASPLRRSLSGAGCGDSRQGRDIKRWGSLADVYIVPIADRGHPFHTA